jgi:DNA-binding LacI/PurR family transcriptional regulator
MARKKLRNMEEFSAVTGLSRPTVSKYFHDPMSVRASTRTRIEAALARYDYRPSFLAMNQNRRNPKTVGIIVPLMTDPFYAEIVRRIELACLAAGYTALVLTSHGSPEEELRAIDMMLSLNMGGVILSPLGQASDAARIGRLAREVPLLMLDSRVEGAGAFVACDNMQGIGLITDHLIATGSAPAYLDMPPVNSTGAERREAYEQAMERHGLTPMVLENPHSGWDAEAQGRAMGRDFFSRGGLPSNTLLCANDRLAIGVLTAACEARVKVGAEGELRVAGHDNHPFAEHTCPGLTTVAQDYDGLAKRAVETILEMMASPSPNGGTARLPSRLILRGSA